MENTAVQASKVPPPARTGEHGVIDGWIQLSVGFAETVTTSIFGFAQDMREETKARVGDTINFVEGAQKGAFTIARKATERVDGVAKDTLSKSEYGVLLLFGALRRASQNVANATSNTLSEVVGNGKTHSTTFHSAMS